MIRREKIKKAATLLLVLTMCGSTTVFADTAFTKTNVHIEGNGSENLDNFSLDDKQTLNARLEVMLRVDGNTAKKPVTSKVILRKVQKFGTYSTMQTTYLMDGLEVGNSDNKSYSISTGTTTSRAITTTCKYYYRVTTSGVTNEFNTYYSIWANK